jgi:hypothetical protein
MKEDDKEANYRILLEAANLICYVRPHHNGVHRVGGQIAESAGQVEYPEE